MQWKQVMAKAEQEEEMLHKEGQTTLQDAYRTSRMQLENWKYGEYRRQRAEQANAHTRDTAQVLRKAAAREAWRMHDMYGVLELALDFTPNELKRAYRRESLANHPDKGGSDEAFQRVAAAQAIMLDGVKRDEYNKGTDLNNPDKESTTLWEEVERLYFPERYGFEPFGDPLEDHPEGKAAHERRQDRILEARHKRRMGIEGREEL